MCRNKENTVQITFIFIDFRVCDFAFAFKTQNAPCVFRVLNAFYFQTDFNLRLKHKRDVRLLVNAFDASYIFGNISFE